MKETFRVRGFALNDSALVARDCAVGSWGGSALFREAEGVPASRARRAATHSRMSVQRITIQTDLSLTSAATAALND